MKILNKKASFEYEIKDNAYEAGLVLLGSEAKAIRNNRADLSRAVVKNLNGELWLVNANITVDQPPKNYNSTRSRKLLMHAHEILALTTKAKQQKLTLVPIALYNRKRLVKLKLALGKAKRRFEKKEALKRKDIKREIVRQFKNSV